MQLRFTDIGWELARGEAEAAEALTRRFYGIPGREWERCPHDVVPRSLEGGGVCGLARLVRLEVASARRLEPLSLYRIELDDAAILRAARRETGVGLKPLLRYVFVHEYVHVVRFALQGLEFEQDPLGRATEEARVHRLSRLVLSQETDPEMEPVLKNYALDACEPFRGKDAQHVTQAG